MAWRKLVVLEGRISLSLLCSHTRKFCARIGLRFFSRLCYSALLHSTLVIRKANTVSRTGALQPPPILVSVITRSRFFHNLSHKTRFWKFSNKRAYINQTESSTAGHSSVLIIISRASTYMRAVRRDAFSNQITFFHPCTLLCWTQCLFKESCLSVGATVATFPQLCICMPSELPPIVLHVVNCILLECHSLFLL